MVVERHPDRLLPRCLHPVACFGQFVLAGNYLHLKPHLQRIPYLDHSFYPPRLPMTAPIEPTMAPIEQTMAPIELTLAPIEPVKRPQEEIQLLNVL